MFAAVPGPHVVPSDTTQSVADTMQAAALLHQPGSAVSTDQSRAGSELCVSSNKAKIKNVVHLKHLNLM